MKYHGIVTVLPLLFFLYSGCVSSVPVVYMSGIGKTQFFISGNRFGLKPHRIEGRIRNWDFSIDPITNKFWKWELSENDNKLYLYEIRGKTIEYKLTLQFDELLGDSFAIFDNKVVISYEDKTEGRYVIVDLLTNERENIQIKNPPIGRMLKGYDGKSLIFENGYYDITENSFHSFKIRLQYPSRYQSVGNLRIGLDEDDFIVYHNIYSNTVEKTSVKRKKISFIKYSTGNSLFYIDLDGRYLYYSKDIYNPLDALWPLYPLISDFKVPKVWYRYNLDKKTTEYVMVPGNRRAWGIIELLRTEPKK